MRATERLLQSPRGTGWAEGQDLRKQGGAHALIYQSFSGLPNFSKNFYLKSVTTFQKQIQKYCYYNFNPISFNMQYTLKHPKEVTNIYRLELRPFKCKVDTPQK